MVFQDRGSDAQILIESLAIDKQLFRQWANLGILNCLASQLYALALLLQQFSLA